MPRVANRASWLAVMVVAVGAVAAEARADCADKVAHYQGGRQRALLCPAEARARGLTLVDLSDDWTPAHLRAGDGQSAPGYRDRFVALANEVDGALRSPSDRHLDLYGIFPSLSVVRRRMRAQQRYQCHIAIDKDPLSTMSGRLREETTAAGKKRLRLERQLRNRLSAQLKLRKLDTFEELAAVNAYYQRQVELLRKRSARTNAIKAAQGHLVCDGYLRAGTADGLINWRTTNALRLYQRRHFLAPTTHLDDATRATMNRSARENDVLTALRSLRERVADATGIIEDGSAGTDVARVAGRRLEDRALVTPRGSAPMPNAAPDRLGHATNEVAAALGWQTHQEVLSFLDRHAGSNGEVALIVAVATSKAPDYHSDHMELEAVIDPGDSPTNRWQRGKTGGRRPALILYARHDGERTALIRWPTTVGGWQDKRLKSRIVARRFMGSDFGDFVWRDLYAAPRWLPPDNTPDDDVVRRNEQGRWALDRELLGPSFRSAYGLAMLVHHTVSTFRDEVRYIDRSVRTHGTGNILSLSRSTSHGCHRLLGVHANRLSAFLLRHRKHIRHGPVKTGYRRVFRYKGSFPVAINERGYRFEFTPPIPIHVGRDEPAEGQRLSN